MTHPAPPTDRPVITVGAVFLPSSLLFGVLAPLACLAADPVLLRGRALGPALLPEFRGWLPAFTILACLALLAELWRRPGSVLLAGYLAGCAIVAGVVGLLLLPLTLVGLMMAIGVFGFVPFLTGFVFLCASMREEARARRPRNLRHAATLLLGVALAWVPLAPPVFGRLATHVGMHWFMSAEPARRQAGLELLEFTGPLLSGPAIWAHDPGMVGMDQLDPIFSEATGEPLIAYRPFRD